MFACLGVRILQTLPKRIRFRELTGEPIGLGRPWTRSDASGQVTPSRVPSGASYVLIRTARSALQAGGVRLSGLYPLCNQLAGRRRTAWMAYGSEGWRFESLRARQTLKPRPEAPHRPGAGRSSWATGILN